MITGSQLRPQEFGADSVATTGVTPTMRVGYIVPQLQRVTWLIEVSDK